MLITDFYIIIIIINPVFQPVEVWLFHHCSELSDAGDEHAGAEHLSGYTGSPPFTLPCS